jgi:hypothetical protein
MVLGGVAVNARRPYRPRPPKRRCPLCGADHYAFQEDALCKGCRPELDTGVGEAVREARGERALLRDVEETFGVQPAVPYGELPEGF